MIISRITVPSPQIKLVAVDPHECRNPEDFLADLSGNVSVFINFYRGRKYCAALGADLNGFGGLFLCLYPKGLRFFRTSRYTLPALPEVTLTLRTGRQIKGRSVDGKDLGRLIYRRIRDLFPFPEIEDFFPIKKRHFYQVSRSLSSIQKYRRSTLARNYQIKKIVNCLNISNKILSFILRKCHLNYSEFPTLNPLSVTHGDLKQLVLQTEAGWKLLGQALESYLMIFIRNESDGNKDKWLNEKLESALHLIQLKTETADVIYEL